MKQVSLKELSKSGVEIELKKRKQLFLLFAALLGVIVLCGIFLTIQQGFGVFTTVPVAFVPLLMLIKKNVNEAKNELELRK